MPPAPIDDDVPPRGVRVARTGAPDVALGAAYRTGAERGAGELVIHVRPHALAPRDWYAFGIIGVPLALVGFDFLGELRAYVAPLVVGLFSFGRAGARWAITVGRRLRVRRSYAGAPIGRAWDVDVGAVEEIEVERVGESRGEPRYAVKALLADERRVDVAADVDEDVAAYVAGLLRRELDVTGEDARATDVAGDGRAPSDVRVLRRRARRGAVASRDGGDGDGAAKHADMLTIEVLSPRGSPWPSYPFAAAVSVGLGVATYPVVGFLLGLVLLFVVWLFRASTLRDAIARIELGDRLRVHGSPFARDAVDVAELESADSAQYVARLLRRALPQPHRAGAA